MSKAERTEITDRPVWEIVPAVRVHPSDREPHVRVYVRDDLTYDEARALQKAITEEMER